MVNQQEKLDALSYCIGAMLGDGWITLNNDGFPQVGIEMLDRECVEFVAASVGAQFECSTNVNEVRRSDGRRVMHRWVTRKRPIFEFFRDITAHREYFPEWFFTASRNECASLVAGLMDTDGYVKEDGSLGFSGTKQKLVFDTGRLLITKLHIRCNGPYSLPQQGCRLPQWRIVPNKHDFIEAGIPLLCERKIARLRTSESSDVAPCVGEGVLQP
jgi:hypothetical protein